MSHHLRAAIVLIVILCRIYSSLNKLDALTNGNYTMANLCNDAMYEGWGKTLAAGRGECTSKHVEKIHLFVRSIVSMC